MCMYTHAKPSYSYKIPIVTCICKCVVMQLCMQIQMCMQVLVNPSVSVFDLLMAEYAMQPENLAAPGVMRAGYLKQLYIDEKDRKKGSGARVQADVPRQFGVAHLAGISDVLSANSVLHEVACGALSARKILYAEMLSGMPPFRVVQALIMLYVIMYETYVTTSMHYAGSIEYCLSKLGTCTG